MSIELEVPISISGDRELVGGVNESLLKHYVSKVLQPASINLIALDASTGSGTNLILDFGNGRQFLNGIIICNSTTAATLTLGAADCLLDIQTKIEWWK